ncbi:MAG: TolC family outer membrane protein [Gammaproteobacteria bacterium]|nr:TolC family outer membrane protein [Gammaproteobacteria bacterium]
MIRILRLIAAAAAPVLIANPVGAADLTEAYRLASVNDPALRAARATRDANFEAQPIARAQLLPNVALTGDATFTHQDVNSSPAGSFNDDFSSGNAAVQVTQPLYRKDRQIRLEQAEVQVEQATVDFNIAEQDLILRTAQAYFGVLSATDTLAFAEAEKKAIARQLDQAKQRFEVGLIAITGVHEAQARFDQARADEILARTNLDNAIEALREITFEPADPLSRLKAKIPLNAPQPASLDEWTELALRNNPGIVSARFDADIARKQIRLADAGDSPALDLVGSYGITGSSADAGTDANTAAIGLQLSMPLYTGGGVAASTRQARFQFEAAQEVLEQRRRAVQTQVRNAYRGVVSSISRVAALAAAQVSAKSALDATEAGFEVGTRTLVDVLDGQRDLFRARRDFAQSRYDYILNTLALFQAAGTLSQEDVDTVNGWLQ